MVTKESFDNNEIALVHPAALGRNMLSLTTIGIIGCGLGLSGTLSGLYFWFQYVKQLGRVTQFDQEKMSLKNEISSLQQSIKDHERAMSQLRSEHDTALRRKDDVQHVMELRGHELEVQVQELKRRLASQENRVENLEQQEKTLLEQVTTLHRDKQDLQRRITQTSESFSASHAEILSKEMEKYKRLQQNMRERETSAKESEERLKTIETEKKSFLDELEVLRRKTTGYNHMIMTLKGQKEMLEDRLQHWENALHILSSQVLAQAGESGFESLNFGQRVTAALKRTHAGATAHPKDISVGETF